MSIFMVISTVASEELCNLGLNLVRKLNAAEIQTPHSALMRIPEQLTWPVNDYSFFKTKKMSYKTRMKSLKFASILTSLKSCSNAETKLLF
jgi:hypothetical protein